jgi:rhodanese-related sulfurtransferase
MSISQVTPEEAKRLLDSGGCVYLDVRTVAEFVAGHPPSALNVPVVELNLATGQMEMNQAFLPIVERTVPRHAQLIVGCQSGGRSQMACELLAEAGFQHLRNLEGGFGGIIKPNGHVLQEGWSTLGYVIERGSGDERSYRALSNRPG